MKTNSKISVLRATAAVILSAVLFGLMPLIAKIVYREGGTPIVLTFLRFALSVPVLYVLYRKAEIPKRSLSSEFWRSFIPAAFSYITTPVLLLLSYSFLSSGLAMTLHYVYPILVIVLTAVFFKQPIAKVQWLCLVLCTLGVLAFYETGSGISLKGVMIALTSGFTYAIYIIFLAEKGLRDKNPIQLSLLFSIFGAVSLLIVLAATGELGFKMSATGWICSLAFSMMTSVFAVILFQSGTRVIGPQNAALYSTFEPLTSVIVGIVVLKESMNIRSLLGIALILVAVSLLTVFEKREFKNPPKV